MTFSDSLLYSILIALFIIILWFIWAYFIYRFSDDRIIKKIISKASTIPNLFKKGEHLLYMVDVDRNSLLFSDPSHNTGTVSAKIIFVLLPGLNNTNNTNNANNTKDPIYVKYNITTDKHSCFDGKEEQLINEDAINLLSYDKQPLYQTILGDPVYSDPKKHTGTMSINVDYLPKPNSKAPDIPQATLNYNINTDCILL